MYSFALCSTTCVMAAMTNTLRHAARQGMILRVMCTACQHTAHFMAADVAKFVNASRQLEELPFRCGECSNRDCQVAPMEHDRDRPPDVIIWRPMRLR